MRKTYLIAGACVAAFIVIASIASIYTHRKPDPIDPSHPLSPIHAFHARGQF